MGRSPRTAARDTASRFPLGPGLEVIELVGALSMTVGASQGRQGQGGQQGQAQRREAAIEKVKDNLYVATSAGAARNNVDTVITGHSKVMAWKDLRRVPRKEQIGL